MSTTCYSYRRFSSREQADGASLDRQRDAALEFVERNQHRGYVLAENHCFTDSATSGYTGENLKEGAALFAFLNAVETGQVKPGSILLVENVDRLSRQEPLKQQQLISRLIHAGITIITLSDGAEYSQEKINAQPYLLFTLLGQMIRAHSESALKSSRVRDAVRRAKQGNQPFTKKCPAWLRVVEADGRKRFEEIKERVAVVQQIFADAAAGLGKCAIAKKLNESGVASWGTGKLDLKGKATGWHESYIQKILTSRAVLGEYQPHKLIAKNKRAPDGPVKPSFFPPIISEELFFAVQAQRSRNAHFRGRKASRIGNLFSGLVRCAYCGGALHFRDHGSRWIYLICYNQKRRLVDCPSVPWPYRNFETSFLAFIRELDYASVLFGDKSEKLTSLENVLAMHEGLKAHAEERLAKMKVLVQAEPSETGYQLITNLEQEVNNHGGTAERLRIEIGAERQAVMRKPDLAVIQTQITESPFRRHLVFELRKIVARIELFSAGINTGGTNLEIAPQTSLRLSCPSAPFYRVHFQTGAQRMVVPNPQDAKQSAVMFDRQEGAQFAVSDLQCDDMASVDFNRDKLSEVQNLELLVQHLYT
jgi:DNA invertase Pin-like site-specific DNA recombinase